MYMVRDGQRILKQRRRKTQKSDVTADWPKGFYGSFVIDVHPKDSKSLHPT